MSYRDRDGEWEVGQRPLSAFEHLAGVQAPKYESSSYQAAARNRKPDPVEPRRMTAKEMEAEYWLHVKSTALAIANAGRRRRGEPLLRCLPQDEPLLPRYERDDPDDASESPDEGDDTPVDDRARAD